MGLDTAGVVEDQAVGLVWVQPKATANHLRVEPRAEGRPKQDDAVNPLGVEPLRINVHVAEGAVSPGLEVLRDPVALDPPRLARDHGGLEPVAPQLARDRLAVVHVHAEEHDRPALLGLDHGHGLAHGLLHDLGLVDGLGQ